MINSLLFTQKKTLKLCLTLKQSRKSSTVMLVHLLHWILLSSGSSNHNHSANMLNLSMSPRMTRHYFRMTSCVFSLRGEGLFRFWHKMSWLGLRSHGVTITPSSSSSFIIVQRAGQLKGEEALWGDTNKWWSWLALVVQRRIVTFEVKSILWREHVVCFCCLSSDTETQRGGLILWCLPCQIIWTYF